MAKKRSSKYSPGLRGASWFKHRIGTGQDFVVGGFKQGNPFEALLVGYYAGRKLCYGGKLKAGFVPAARRALMQQLMALVTDKCPFADLPEISLRHCGKGLTAAKMAKCT